MMVSEYELKMWFSRLHLRTCKVGDGDTNDACDAYKQRMINILLSEED